jgi:hypothetical protein
MLSSRTLISLSQYLALQPEVTVNLVAQKCGAPAAWSGLRGPQPIYEYIRNLPPGTHREMLDEICRSTRMLRNDVSPKYLYDERWTDLARCLLLDGYQIHGDYSTGYSLTALDPTIEAVRPVDDDLTTELLHSNLPAREDVVRLMKNSADDFCKQPQDFNGSLTSARVSLETLARNIAEVCWTKYPMVGDPTKFGANIAYLRNQVNFLSQKEETGIAGVYAFVSPGAHIPIGLTEEEMVRLGRTMVAAMCYFLIKRYNR